MRGLLVDVNVEGHLPYLLFRLEALQLRNFLSDIGIEFATFESVRIARDISDRDLWHRCQDLGWVLFAENRNHADSLEAVLTDSWREGCIPVITLSDKSTFERQRIYADRVATSIAEVLFAIKEEAKYRTEPRIWVPL